MAYNKDICNCKTQSNSTQGSRTFKSGFDILWLLGWRETRPNWSLLPTGVFLTEFSRLSSSARWRSDGSATSRGPWKALHQTAPYWRREAKDLRIPAFPLFRRVWQNERKQPCRPFRVSTPTVCSLCSCSFMSWYDWKTQSPSLVAHKPLGWPNGYKLPHPAQDRRWSGSNWL